MTRKIIIVDDSLTVRLQVIQVLEKIGFDIVQAEDGLDGLDKIAEHGDALLVLADINMPRMNGIEMLEEIKRKGQRCPPIVMLTTEGQSEWITRAKGAGAKGWMVKPFDPEQLVSLALKLAGPA